jgi:hypothetical protein
MSDTPIVSYVAPASDAKGKTKKAGTPWLPKSDADVSSVGQTVRQKWIESGLVLIWITVEEFTAALNKFDSFTIARSTKGGKRTPVSERLGQLDELIDKSIEYIKDYLAEMYDHKTAPSHYGLFGIVKTYKGWKLPPDRQKRLKALAMLLSAAADMNWNDRKYNLAFWQPIYDEYKFLVDNFLGATGDVSKIIDDKAEQKTIILNTMQSLVYLLRANYPKNYEAILRSWGFLREMY